jgi:CHAD domain-containing protein
LRRVNQECIEKALCALKQCETLEAIHSVRKEIKKLRAVLRLVRASVGRGFYRKAGRDLREAARNLGAARDAHVTFKALKDLLRFFHGELAPRPFSRIRRALRERCVDEKKRFRKQRVAQRAARLLKKAAQRLEKMMPEKKDWAALSTGLKESYRHGRKAHQCAVAKPTPRNLHEWRKRVKDLWYQLRLVCPIWPDELQARSAELKALSEYLGDAHDLVMLKQFAEDRGDGDTDKKELDALCGLMERRQRELRRRAMTLGARFYLEKPSDFCHRLEGYWNIWRKRQQAA